MTKERWMFGTSLSEMKTYHSRVCRFLMVLIICLLAGGIPLHIPGRGVVDLNGSL